MRRLIVLTFSLIALLLLAAHPASANDDLLGTSLLDSVGEVVDQTVEAVSVDSSAEEVAPVALVDASSTAPLDNAVPDVVAPIVDGVVANVAEPIVDNTVNDVVEPVISTVSETVGPVTDAVIPPLADSSESTMEPASEPDSPVVVGVVTQTQETVSDSIDAVEGVVGAIEPNSATDLISTVAGSDENGANDIPDSDQQSTGPTTENAPPLLAETLSNAVAPVAGIALS